MRILWIKTELLHPVDKGGRIRSYQMLRSLARAHQVTYLALDDGQAAADALSRVREYAQAVVTVPFRPARKWSPGFFVDLLRNLCSPLPYAVARYESSGLRREIQRLAKESELIVCDFLTPSVNVPDGLPAPAILFQHNIEAMIWQRHAAVARNPLRRAYMRLQWRRMQRHEAAECRRFSHVVAVSEVDAILMRREYGVESVSHVPTGVDLEYFTAQRPRPVGGAELVFVGSMDWMPNDDGIRWFAAEVFPLVTKEVAAAKLTVVGRSPSQGLRALAARNPAIEVTGTVADVRPYLERAAVSIVPLRVGGGTRLKIYEAMAMASPVVATTIGAEGLPVRHGEHLLIADTTAEQATAIVGLLRDRARADRIAGNALKFVRDHCGWDGVAQQFLSQCLTRAVAQAPTHEDLVA
jgi:glycosyltransferase involved in cell wall biosynthesis